MSSYTIESDVKVGIIWDDTAGEWTVHPAELNGPLDYVTAISVVADNDDYDHDKAFDALERGNGVPVTADDLARMLGSAIVQPVRESNKYVEHRPANPRLIGILKDRITEVTGPQLNAIQVAEIVQKILPIISSCDENAHMRGRAEALAEVDGQVDGGTP